MQILRNLRGRIRPDPAQAGVYALSVLVFLAVLVYAFGSDIRELACNRLQDDSYYYLQPAWNFSRSGVFTFDGEHSTYGFQPLWMIVLAFLARLSPDKVFFLRAAVALGGLFFCLTGLALFHLAREWTSGWWAVIAPALWTANASLLGANITGKENALYGFGLVICCIRISRRMKSPGSGSWTDGIFLGLMVLSRINAIVPAVLLLAVLGIWGAGPRGERVRRMLTAGAGMLAVLAVWGVYAQISFGALFPNSGTAKLFGSSAALALFMENHLPWIPHAWIEALVPAAQRVLLTRPEFLVQPTKAVAISYLAGLLPDLAYGSWARIFPFLGALGFRIKVLVLASVGIGTAVWVVGRLRTPQREGAAAVGVILVAAAANFVSNWLFLPDYLLWGIWYTVPETLTLILAIGCILGEGLSRLADVRGRIGGLIGRSAVAVAALLALMGVAQVWTGTLPRPYVVAPDGTQQEAYEAALWMNAHLPEGARVGSFSAGLLGYFADCCRVINLDGLANTPGFIDEELIGHILYDRGLADQDPLRAYLRSEGIVYLANVDPKARIDRGEYLGLVDSGGGILLYEGDYPIVWGPGQPEQRMIVAEIKS
jgi:hypothetical protein